MSREFFDLIQVAEENGVRGMLLIVLEDLDEENQSLERLREKYREMYLGLSEICIERFKKNILNDSVYQFVRYGLNMFRNSVTRLC